MRFTALVGLIVLGATGAAFPALAGEKAATSARAVAAAPQTFSIKLPGTHRATGLTGRMVAFATQQLQAKGYRPAAKGEVSDLIVKLRFEDSYSFLRREDDLMLPSAPVQRSSALAPPQGYSTSGEAFPYPSADPWIGLGRRAPSLSSREAKRTNLHHLYVGLSVETRAGNQVLHVKEIAQKAEYAQLDEVGRQLVGAAIAGAPNAGR